MSFESYVKRVGNANKIFNEHLGFIFIEIEEYLSTFGFKRTQKNIRNKVDFQHGEIDWLKISFEAEHEVDLILKTLVEQVEIPGKIILELEEGQVQYIAANTIYKTFSEALNAQFARY